MSLTWRTLSPAERRLTAYHEAGHALAYIDHGLGFRHITMRPNGNPDHVGKVCLWGPRVIPMWTREIVLAAGPAAELYVTALEDAGDDPEHVGLTVALHLADVTATGDHRELQNLSLNRIDITVSMLERRWTEVDALAQALLTAPRAMSHREVMALLS